MGTVYFIFQPSGEGDELRRNLFPYRGLNPGDYMLENYEKILVENIYQSQDYMDWTILRLGALYGEFDSNRRMSEYIKPMLTGAKDIELPHDKAGWSWTRAYVKNMVQAIKMILEMPAESVNQVFNVGNEQTWREIELLQNLKTITSWKGDIRLIGGKENNGYNYGQSLILNTSKVRDELGYEEKYSFEESLIRTTNFIRSHNM